ncbi:ABC transporter permease [Vibrio cholerae]
MFRATYFIVLLICIMPIMPGILGVMLSSLGYMPVIGFDQITLAAYGNVLQWPGVGRAIGSTLTSALVSTYLACAITFAILQSLWMNKHWRKVELLLSPLLAMPHVAFAIGFAFLFSPTGLLARWANQWLMMGSDTHNAAWLIHDPYAAGLTIALALKEVPFLLLMSIPVLGQLNLPKLAQVSHSLGYSCAQMWWKVVLPQWLRKMRFPLFAVIAYGVSVVDLSLILGPTNPPTFAVMIWQWFNDPDLNVLPRAAAGAVTLFAIASGLLLAVVVIEKAITQFWSGWQYSGRAGLALPGKSVFTLSALFAASMLPIMLVWSVAQRWRFPDLLPTSWSGRFWHNEWQNVLPTISDSLLLALTATTIALIAALVCHEYRLRSRLHVPGFVIALPMLVPQLSILFGLQIVTLSINSELYWVWTVWAHVFFAFPFVYLALDGPWRSYNLNYTKAALSLGKSPLCVFFTIKARLLFPAICYAWAVGASVSLAQYLPTLMLGAGRIATITTEAVALSSGFDRRVTAIYAIWQALLPFVFFSGALLLSRSVTRRTTRRVSENAVSATLTSNAVKEDSTHDALPQKPRHP